MPDPLTLVPYAVLALLRNWRVPFLVRLPVHRGPEWCFDSKLGARDPQRAMLLRRYRAWIVGATIVWPSAATRS